MERRTYPSALLAALLFPLIGQAQTGPGGVGNSTNNVLWLSAESGVFNNAGSTPAANTENVQQWNDRSGNGRHATQATVGNRPNLQTNVLNGYPVVRYSAANNDRMASTGLATANSASVFVVARYTTLPSPNPGLVQGTPAGLAYTSDAAQKSVGMWVASGNTRLWGRGVQSNGIQRQISQVTPIAANTTYLMNSVYGGTVIQQYVNNGVSGSETYDGTLLSWTDMAIGAQHGTESWNGDIAEVTVYNTNVNDAQRIIIANYMAAKYGLALAANDIYREDNVARGNFDHEVAGIGRVNASNIHNDAQGSGIVRISNPAGLGNNEFLFWGHNNGMLGAWGVDDVPDGLQGRLERVWRVSERNTTGASAVDVGAVDITFDLSGLGNVDAAHLRLVVDTDLDGILADEIPIAGATHAGGNLYRFSAVTALVDGARFTLGTTNMAITPLPIELVSFTANSERNGTVQLDWATASEWDNRYFEVERSDDLSNWSVIGRVEAVGHSNALVEYDAIDELPLRGTNYYRLRQVDLDGTSTTSHVAVVEIAGTSGDPFSLYPNPATEGVFLRCHDELPEGLVYQLLAASGQVVRQGRSPNCEGQGHWLELNGLDAGTYTLLLQVGTERFAERVMLVR